MIKTIFCIDDDETLAEVIAARLLSKGYNTLAFRDADEAIAKIEEVFPDLILIDKLIDSRYGEDGIALCKKIRSLPKGEKIKIVLLSGLIDDVDIKRGKAAGIDDFIHKPFEAKKFFKLIERLLA